MKRFITLFLTLIMVLSVSLTFVGCRDDEGDTFGNEETFTGEYTLATQEETEKFNTVYLNSTLKELSPTQSREYNLERRLDIEPVSQTIDRTFMLYGDDNGNITMAGEKSTSKSIVGISTELKNNYYYDGAYCYYTEVDAKSTPDNIVYDKVKTEVGTDVVFGFLGIGDFDLDSVYNTYATDPNGKVSLYFDYNHNEDGEVSLTKVNLSIRITEAVKKELSDQKYFEDSAPITVKTAEYYYIFLFDNNNQIVGWRKYITCNYDVKSQGEGSTVMVGVKGAYIEEMLIVDTVVTLPSDLSDYVIAEKEEISVFPGDSVGSFKIDLFLTDTVVKDTDLSGKIILVNFWQMDNSSHIPILQEVYDYYEGEVKVLAINGDDGYSDNMVEYFISDVDTKNNKADWSTYNVMFGKYSSQDKLFNRFMLKTYPATALINKDGKLVEVFTGDVTLSQLKVKIDKILNSDIVA